ncbi:MAG TPA: hypothetical protein PK957_04235 [Candidatus Dojkabacteria bacterium]|nr:hypothetical protein [Candidatus Dojkabacteria bacterium]HQF37215.1 hypothetical protein [Candidatus Dojkabacteria bacterium]
MSRKCEIKKAKISSFKGTLKRPLTNLLINIKPRDAAKIVKHLFDRKTHIESIPELLREAFPNIFDERVHTLDTIPILRVIISTWGSVVPALCGQLEEIINKVEAREK